MEQEKYELLLSILKDYYGQQHQRGFESNPEEVAGELASLISTVVGPVRNGQGLYPNAPQVSPYMQNNFPLPHVNAGPLAWHQLEVREPVPKAAEACSHKLHEIAERAQRDIAMIRKIMVDKPVGFVPKAPPMQSVADFGGEHEDEDDRKRKRNREAQKRFRDKQKRKKNDLESEYQALMDSADQLEEENIDLEQRMSLEIRTVAVSEAILLAFEGQTMQTNSILDVILPTREKHEIAKKVEDILPKLSSPSKDLKKVLSRDVSPELQKLYHKAFQMKTPDSLYLYYREWQIESKHLLSKSQSQKNPRSVELMVSRMNELYQVWTINLFLYPDNFTQVFADNYPPSEQAEKLWTFISEELYKCLKKEQLVLLQKEFNKYCDASDVYENDINEAWKELEKLQVVSNEAPKTWREVSAMNIKLVSQTQICNSLLKNYWDNAVEYANKWVEAVGLQNAFLCNTFASPHTVDWTAISKRLVDMAQNKGVLANTID